MPTVGHGVMEDGVIEEAVDAREGREERGQGGDCGDLERDMKEMDVYWIMTNANSCCIFDSHILCFLSACAELSRFG